MKPLKKLSNGILIALILGVFPKEVKAQGNSLSEGINLRTNISLYHSEKVTDYGESASDYDVSFSVKVTARKDGAYIQVIEHIEKSGFCFDGRAYTFIPNFYANGEYQVVVDHMEGDPLGQNSVRQTYLIPQQNKPVGLEDLPWAREIEDPSSVREWLQRRPLLSKPTWSSGHGGRGDLAEATRPILKAYAPDIDPDELYIRSSGSGAYFRNWGEVDKDRGELVAEYKKKEQYTDCVLERYDYMTAEKANTNWQNNPKSTDPEYPWKTFFISEDLDGAKQVARKKNKPLLIFLENYQNSYGSFGVAMRYSNPELLRLMQEDFVPMVMGMNTMSPIELKQLKIIGTPHLLIMNSEGTLVSLPANMSEQELVAGLKNAIQIFKERDLYRW